MNVAPIAKGIVDIVVSAGVGSIVTNAVRATTPVNTSRYQQVTRLIGSFVVSGFVADKVAKHTVEQIEVIAAEVKTAAQKARNKTTD